MADDTRPPSQTLPALPRQDEKVPVHLERLAETARDYARGAKAAATLRAYAADWRHYTAWCRRKELEPLPPDPQVVGLYLAASASEPPAPGQKPNAVRTIERRLSAIAWNCACCSAGLPVEIRPHGAGGQAGTDGSYYWGLCPPSASPPPTRPSPTSKASLQAERNAYAKQQTADRAALTDRHRKGDQQFDRAVTARAELDRAAEIEARRAQARTLDRQRTYDREQGRDTPSP
jgi:hypothetical protein